MSLIGRPIQWDKRCFAYCGDDRCDCGASASLADRKIHFDQLLAEDALMAAKEKNKRDGEEDVN